MSCCGGRSYTPKIYPPTQPIAGHGWKIYGWPPMTPQKVIDIHGANPVWDAYTADESLKSCANVLSQNGIDVNNEVWGQLTEWADANYCQLDPSRCEARKNSTPDIISKRRAHNVNEKMAWAGDFWRTWNAGLSNPIPDEQAIALMESMVQVGLIMTDGDALGCDNCNEHFKRLLAEYPIENIGSLDRARVWLWRVHNETRENKTPTPYRQIALIYGWRELTDTELYDTIKDLRA